MSKTYDKVYPEKRNESRILTDMGKGRVLPPRLKKISKKIRIVQPIPNLYQIQWALLAHDGAYSIQVYQ